MRNDYSDYNSKIWNQFENVYRSYKRFIASTYLVKN